MFKTNLLILCPVSNRSPLLSETDKDPDCDTLNTAELYLRTVFKDMQEAVDAWQAIAPIEQQERRVAAPRGQETTETNE